MLKKKSKQRQNVHNRKYLFSTHRRTLAQIESKITLRVQSFSFMIADLCQDINRVSSFNRCLMEHILMEDFLEGNAPLRHYKMQNLYLCLDVDLPLM